MINARAKTAATGIILRPLWERGRAIVSADSWYKWVRGSLVSGMTKKDLLLTRQ
ncbi:hypothetical protein [Enterobacter asburiae]|uniref:hypothetical protein n=1 Tax=Enterobacter asburiae TaxID=61645 RepID=UPI002FF50E9C